jgi:signal transduction histidine kinase
MAGKHLRSFLHVRLGIQKKAIAGISVLLAIMVFSLMWISMHYNNLAIRSELMKRGRVSTDNLAYNAAYATLIGDTVALADFVDGVMAEQEVVYARILGTEGETLVERERLCLNDSASGGHAQVRPADQGQDMASTAGSGARVAGHATSVWDSGSVIEFRSAIVISEKSGDRQGAELDIYGIDEGRANAGNSRVIGAARIGITTRYIDAEISDMRRNMLGIASVLILVALVITSVAVRLSLRPINDLVVATGRVAGGDYDCKVRVDRKDEIGDLAASFNKMTEDLKSSRTALVEKKLLEALVAELKQTQQQLIQAGKMAAVGQLAAGVAHEINNPLAGIMGYSQLVVEKMRRRLDTGITAEDVPKFLSYVENMERQSQRCKNIVQNLLKFARASSREELREIDCNAVLRETIAFVDHQLEMNRITIVFHREPDLRKVLGLDGKMQQIFTNIIINAMQAIREKGTITLTTRNIGNRVNIEIEDTGEGIATEHLDKIFEPFFTTKEIGKGTGLGLSVTYGLVQDMSGDIAVRSEVGIGTTFTLSFPASPGLVPSGSADHGDEAVGVLPGGTPQSET